MRILLPGRLIALCCVAACLCCCSCLDGNEKVITSDGTVQLANVSGDCWCIVGKDGVTYEPLNLPDEFKVDGLEVRFTATLEEDMLTTCMVGRVAKLLGIRKAS